MAKNGTLEHNARRIRYEYRVWGKHGAARKRLAKLGTERYEEHVDDCYLLVEDTSWNAKVRNNTLKIKQLVDADKGFEQWASGRHHTAEATPEPFDQLFEQLRLDRPQRGKPYDLEKELARLDPESGVRAVFVRKDRVRYRVGALRAEVTDITIRESGDVLRTLSIEGEDLDELKALRKQLGLRGEPNVAVHQAIDAEIDD